MQSFSPTDPDYNDSCFKKTFCRASLIMTTGEVELPYTILSRTKSNPEDICEEKGILKVKRSWNVGVEISTDDKCSAEVQCEP